MAVAAAVAESEVDIIIAVAVAHHGSEWLIDAMVDGRRLGGPARCKWSEPASFLSVDCPFF